jgi:hypothetical protein
MNSFIQESESERRFVFEEASGRLGLPAVSIEKDFWVCWTLRQLFALPDGIGEALCFKGGTSLSKAWKLIERFSEDIDIVIGREHLGFTEEKDVLPNLTANQTKKRLKKLRKACGNFIAERLAPQLNRVLQQELASSYSLIPDPSDSDAQTLLFRYPSVFADGSANYLRREVKIEMGARSDTWPAFDKEITPYAAEVLPDVFEGATSTVKVIDARRTCLDKMLLLHEENCRPGTEPKKERLSRHYYDLHHLIGAGIASEAIQNNELLAKVLEHRAIFFSYDWMNWSDFQVADLQLSPKSETMSFWEQDYGMMRAEMFFGDPPEFDEILKSIEDFKSQFVN